MNKFSSLFLAIVAFLVSTNSFAVKTSQCASSINLTFGSVVFSKPFQSLEDHIDSYFLGLLAAESHTLVMDLVSTASSTCRYEAREHDGRLVIGQDTALMKIEALKIEGSDAKPKLRLDFSIILDLPTTGILTREYVTFSQLADYSGKSEFFINPKIVSLYVRTCRELWDESCFPDLVQVGEWNEFNLLAVGTN